MTPRSIVAHPADLAARPEPTILPLPGADRRADREPAAPPRRPAAPPQPEVGPRDILNALHYHSVLFVTLGTLIAGGLGTAAWFLVPAKYTTYAMILVGQKETSVVPRVGDDGGRAEFATYIKTQANIIKSTATMTGALRDPKAGIAQLAMLRREDDPVSFLEDKILTEFSETSEILKVMLTGDDPVEITKIVNAVVDCYKREYEVQREWKHRRIEMLEKNRREVQDLLAKKLQHFDDEFGPPAGSEAAQSKKGLRLTRYATLVQRQDELQSALARARDELKDAQTKLEQLEAAPVPLPDLTQRIETDQTVAVKAFLVRKCQTRLDDYVRMSSNPYGPKYTELRRALEAATADLEAQKRQLRSAAESEVRTAQRAQYQTNVEKAQAEVRRLEAIERSTVDELTKFQDLDKETADKKAPERIQQGDDITRYRDQLATIERSILALKTELDAPERVRFPDHYRAQVPMKRELKKTIAATAFAVLFGFGLVGSSISLYELRRKRVYGLTDPLFQQRLPLLGCIPDHVVPTDPARAVGADEASRVFFEAVDKVKTVLCRQMQRRQMQALLVTSAAPGEGKSALAWHLALSLARTDKRTLFIDGNLRNPGLHNHFDIASHPGLSELLRGERSMPEVVQRTPLANLWCIAAGVCDEQARHSLDKDGLRRLLDRARQDYDYIVIDCCSIREAVDPLYISQRADATVLSVRTYASRTTDVERACERLSLLGTPLLGAILCDPAGAACEL
jgi:capsular exopolysaccharide synthesis family protein